MSVYVNSSATIEDVELYLLDPAQAATRIEGHAVEMLLRRAPLLQDRFEIKAAVDSPVCTTQYSSASAMSTDWLGWALELYVRGTLVFTGPIIGGKASWAGRLRPDESYEAPGSYVTLTAETWFSALLRRRYVATSDGAQYTKTDTPNRIAADLIRTNCVSGAVVTPTNWQTASEVRYAFSPYTVACSVPSTKGTSTTWKADVGTNLLTTLLELANASDDQAEWLWPTQSRSGATITFGFLVGRSGGSREIGTNMSASVTVTAERGNLIGFEREFTRADKVTHIQITGKGRETQQRRRYKYTSGGAAGYGIAEEYLNLPHGGTDLECDQEAQRLLNERAAGANKRTYEVAEIADFQWPADFDIGDTLAFGDPFHQTGASEMIIGLEWRLVAPGPIRLRLETGVRQTSPEQAGGRSGGGGGGGKGGGGRPRSKAGDMDWVVEGGDCITVTEDDTEIGVTTYTVGFTSKTWGAIAVDGGNTLTPTTCYQTLQIIGDRCIEVTKLDDDSIRIRNTHYWFNKVTIVDPSFTLTADACDEQVNFASAGGLSWSGSGNTLTVSAANLTYYSQVLGDTGSTTAAAQNDAITIAGGDGIATTATEGGADTLTIDLRLPATTATEVSANYLKVWDATGAARAVKTWPATS